MKKYLFISLVLFLLPVNFSVAAPHHEGTNVVGPDGTVYLIKLVQQPALPCIGCPTPPPILTKFPYPSAAVFLSYSFNSWDKVVPASAQDLALPSGPPISPALGSLIQQQGTSTVYIITPGGTKAGFTSYGVFQELGYNPGNIFTADISYVEPNLFDPFISSSTMAHSPGTLINLDGTIYLIGTGRASKYGIPNMRVFNSWGFSFNKVVLGNNYDRQIDPARTSGPLYERRISELSPI